MIQKQKQYIQRFSKKVTNPKFAWIIRNENLLLHPFIHICTQNGYFFVNTGKVEYKIFGILL